MLRGSARTRDFPADPVRRQRRGSCPTVEVGRSPAHGCRRCGRGRCCSCRRGAVVSPSAEGTDRIRRLLGSPETAWLLERMRARLEQKGTLEGTVTKQGASTAERMAAGRLIGRPVRSGSSASVSLDQLDVMLRRDAWPAGLASAVVALVGPIVGPDVRRAERESWHEVSDALRLIANDRPQLSGWVENVNRSGALRRATASAAAAHEMSLQLGVLARALPVEGVPLGVLAARLFGDAHALDPKTPLGPLAVGLAAAATGQSPGTGSRWRRDAWQSCGVVVDELSSTVLALGLPGGLTSPTARALAALGEAGQPAVLTYRQLAVDDIGRAPLLMSVCENPAVIAAAADRFGASAGAVPLVCVNGQPGAAVIRLLTQLVDGGARLRYHGDFDAGGLSIARTVARSVPWTPWRFGETDYRSACASSLSTSVFSGAVGDTPWDGGLSGAMEELRLRVEEESVLADLLDDLRVD
ncbi:TIGR02679 family protein [Cryobacterium sp. TmT2-59]|nr:TIGR02679 family protein [Cryobacterium sp. TmT2-59]